MTEREEKILKLRDFRLTISNIRQEMRKSILEVSDRYTDSWLRDCTTDKLCNICSSIV